MNEDKLLRDLARLAHDEDEHTAERFDARWDALAGDRLSAEEEAALRAEIAGDPELELAFEGFRPLSSDLRTKIVSDAAARLQAPRPAAEPAPVLAFPGKLPRKAWLGGLAVAAGLVLAVALWRLPGASAPLPGYELSWRGGLATQRAGGETSEEGLRLARGIGFEIVLRPQTAVAAEIQARVFTAGGASWARWPAAEALATYAEGGAVQIAGVFGGDLPPGTYRLAVAVGRPEDLPGAEELEHPPPHPGWQLLETRLEVVAPEDAHER